jgi:hypothetical protein
MRSVLPLHGNLALFLRGVCRQLGNRKIADVFKADTAVGNAV